MSVEIRITKNVVEETFEFFIPSWILNLYKNEKEEKELKVKIFSDSQGWHATFSVYKG